MVEDWLTTAEAVSLSGYYLGHLRLPVHKGKIDGRKFGPVWQVSRKSLLHYIRAIVLTSKAIVTDGDNLS